jgi:hypothetical protein
MNSIKYWLSVLFEWIMQGSYKVMDYLNGNHDWYLLTTEEMDIIFEEREEEMSLY